MLRVRLERPLLWGMAGCAFFGLPMLVLGLQPHVAPLVIAFFVAGIGIEMFGLGWNLAMQEHVPDEMLSRAYSYDSLGSFIAIPIGQLVAGPAGHRCSASGRRSWPRDPLRRRSAWPRWGRARCATSSGPTTT